MAMEMDGLELVFCVRRTRKQLHVCPAMVMDSDCYRDWNIKCQKETPQEGLAPF